MIHLKRVMRMAIAATTTTIRPLKIKTKKPRLILLKLSKFLKKYSIKDRLTLLDSRLQLVSNSNSNNLNNHNRLILSLVQLHLEMPEVIIAIFLLL